MVLPLSILFSIENPLIDSLYNIGSLMEVSIRELAELISKIVGYDGRIKWDQTKPDGTPRKLMDSSKINLAGWKVKIDLKKGIESLYRNQF